MRFEITFKVFDLREGNEQKAVEVTVTMQHVRLPRAAVVTRGKETNLPGNTMQSRMTKESECHRGVT
jgi:hypothetical protein